jgi:hypothetical protein
VCREARLTIAMEEKSKGREKATETRLNNTHKVLCRLQVVRVLEIKTANVRLATGVMRPV